MALLNILFGIQRAKIGLIEIDADLRTVHNSEWLLTEHPIETGSVITDHKVEKPRAIEIVGAISNLPIDDISIFSLTEQRAHDAWLALNDLAKSRELITVFTGLEELSDMQILSLTAERDKEKANILYFTARCREVIQVYATTVAALTAEPTIRKPQPPPTKKATPPASFHQQESALNALVR